MMALAFWAVGIITRSSYMQAEDSMTMPSSTEVEGGGGAAATVQSAVGGRSGL